MNLENIPLGGIKGILLDFDNTFYEYEPCHKKALEAVFDVYKITRNISYDEFLDLYSDSQKKVKANTKGQAASHSRFLYFQRLLESQEGKTNVEEATKLEDLYWSAFQRNMQPKKEMMNFLTRCKEDGIKTCFVTNLTASVQFRKMVAIGVDTLVDFVVTSEEAGAEKPSASIFSLALEKLGLSPSEVIMIGDDKIKDIDGANKLGIKGYMV